MFVREIKSEEKIKAEPLELNPAPGSFEAGNLSKFPNKYLLPNKLYNIFADNVKRVY
jgi:hypothetical protein